MSENPTSSQSDVNSEPLTTATLGPIIPEKSGHQNPAAFAPETYSVPNEQPGVPPVINPAPVMAAANSPGGPAYPYPASGNQPQGQAPYPMPPAPGGGQYPGQQPNQAPPAQPYYAAPPPPVPGVVQPPAYPAYQPVTVTPGFAAAGQQPPVVVFNPATAVGHNPTTLRCPHCSAQVTTDVTYEAEGSTWLMCLIIFGTGCLFTILLLIGFFLWFVCFVPFCIKECKAAIHTCPNCKTEIARKRPKYLS